MTLEFKKTVPPSNSRSTKLAHTYIEEKSVSQLSELSGKKVLFVASTGGHLYQLNLISRRFSPAVNSKWVSFDTSQSRSLLSGRRREFVQYVSPRNLRQAVKTVPTFWKIMRDEDWDAVVSTGAAVAVPALLLARFLGIRAIYIESVSRFDGPSLTGKILTAFPRIVRFAQHQGYSKRWTHDFSILDSYSRVLPPAQTSSPTIFVTLGTIKPYRFDSLVDAVIRSVPEHANLIWQLGETTRNNLPGEVFHEMSAEDFSSAVDKADLVVTHGGVGTILNLLDRKKPFIAIPRRSCRKEHVDDHQAQITGEIARRGLATVREADELTPELFNSLLLEKLK